MLSFCRSGKIETATVAYVQRLSTTFFANIEDSSVEFRRAFTPGGATSKAAYTQMRNNAALLEAFPRVTAPWSQLTSPHCWGIRSLTVSLLIFFSKQGKIVAK